MTDTHRTLEEIGESVRRFAGRNAQYYVRAFERIHTSEGFVWTFNWAAALLGPLWAGARGLWGAFASLAMLDTLALVQIGRGMLAQAGAAGMQQAALLRSTADAREAFAEQALRDGDAATSHTFARIAHNLHAAADRVMADAQQSGAHASRSLLAGLALFVGVRFVMGLLANNVYERQYSAWRSNAAVAAQLRLKRMLAAVALVIGIYPLTVYRFAYSNVPGVLVHVPVDKARFAQVSHWLDAWFDGLYRVGSGGFDAIRDGIRMLVGAMETVLVQTPWPVVMAVIIVAAWRLAGARVALFTAGAVAYLAVLGMWEPAMQTVALLGTAAFICVAMGVPLGIWLARSPRAYAMARPILDLMQTMPAIVYLIPAIAFFGTGTPPGIVATLVFGMPPVIRMTALGIQQVPAAIKEGACAFGASQWQLLRGVELPLALPTIMAGVTQTILMCLSMVVVAALIGAQGLGSTVLEALQFAATGQGILAGIAILLCAIVIDRIVQGSIGTASDRERRR